MNNKAVNLSAKIFRDDPDVQTCFVNIAEIGFGIWQYTVWSKRSAAPIGFAWCNVEGGRGGIRCIATVGFIFVQPYYRRFGVAKLIHREIFRLAERIETANGSNTGGFAMMKSMGYRFDKKRGRWWCDRPKCGGTGK